MRSHSFAKTSSFLPILGRLVLTLALTTALSVASVPVGYADVTLPGYTESVYITDLPATPAGLTIDQDTLTIYFADHGNCNGRLRQIAADKTVSIVTTDFTPLGGPTCQGGFYPYHGTDIHFSEGYVYASLARGELVQIDTAAGTSTIVHTFADFGVESGLDVNGSKVYVTDGEGSANQLREYDLSEDTESTLVSGLPASSYGLEYHALSDSVYFATAGSGFYSADLVGGTYSLISSAASEQGNFAVDPNGEYLYARVGTTVLRITIADGSAMTFMTNLSDDSENDLAFGPSSIGSGTSLYVVDGTSILEVSGFGGVTDLSIAKAVTPSVVEPGQPLTYTLSFSNAGSFTATNVVITDVVPISVTNVSHDSSGATITPTGSVSYTWQVQDLAPAAGGIITITGVLTNGLAAGHTFINTAAITTTTRDSDDSNNGSTAGVTVANASPVAVDDDYDTSEDTPLAVAAPGVMSNDSDSNGDTLTTVLDGGPANGTLTLNTDGSFIYTPTLTFNGTDTFAYVVNDGFLADTATVTVNVSAVNDAPTFTSAPVMAATEDVAYVYNVTATDVDTGDGLTITAPILPGWLTLTDHGDGTATLSGTPTSADVGDHSVGLQVTDGIETVPQPFTITVSKKVTYYVYLPLVAANYVSAPDLVVESITATSSDVQVVIRNVGNASVVDEFWVDVYIDPDLLPTGVNQTWDMLGSQGMVWGITGNALPLAPGGVINLAVGDGYYWPAPASHVVWPLAVGTPVYAQVDSANIQSNNGAVLESHEIVGGVYNNISHTISTASAGNASLPPSESKVRPAPSGALPVRP